MNIEAYRRLQQRILLPSEGGVPSTHLRRDEEQESALSRIDRTWRLIEQYPLAGASPNCYRVPTEIESWSALKRWFSSHHLFIPQLALTGYCLGKVTRARESGQPERARYWMRLASRLRKGCGALFMFAVDYSPCAAIYCEVIRGNMPVAFSGFWIRERQHNYLPALKQFSGACLNSSAEELCITLRKEWSAAERRYHELHEQSMYLAVPDGVSLARNYRHETGKGHEITEREFQCYDTWFCIDRSYELTRLEYVFQVCDVIERVVADLATGHSLEASVTRELLDGAKAAMVVFGQWAGPVSERSAFYPKSLRGE
jgi:hypothetical protein